MILRAACFLAYGCLEHRRNLVSLSFTHRKRHVNLDLESKYLKIGTPPNLYPRHPLSMASAQWLHPANHRKCFRDVLSLWELAALAHKQSHFLWEKTPGILKKEFSNNSPSDIGAKHVRRNDIESKYNKPGILPALSILLWRGDKCEQHSVALFSKCDSLLDDHWQGSNRNQTWLKRLLLFYQRVKEVYTRYDTRTSSSLHHPLYWIVVVPCSGPLRCWVYRQYPSLRTVVSLPSTSKDSQQGCCRSTTSQAYQ